MTKILLLIVSLISVLAFVLAIYFLFKNTSQFKSRKKSLIIIISLILIAISFFIIAIAINYIDDVFNQPTSFKDFTNIGAYGDFLGGILNPILAFIGIIAASLAFYAQYEANRQVQIQFKEQKKKERLDYVFNKFNSQIQLILEEINNFQLSHYYTIYLKDKPVNPGFDGNIFLTSYQQELMDKYYEKMKEYYNSKKYEKRNFEGIIAINELFTLINKKNNRLNLTIGSSFEEDYFDSSFNNPKVNEVYNILSYLNLTINEIEIGLNDRLNLKADLISRLLFLYNSKLLTIVNNNYSNLEDENFLKLEMEKLNLYFNKKTGEMLKKL